MAEQKQQQAFHIKSDPIKRCEYECVDDEEWSCEHCSNEGGDLICTWKPEKCVPFESEELSESAPCEYWEERLQSARFLSPLKASIFNSSNQKIGEISGWWLTTEMIIHDERRSFLAMDGISHLLMCAHHLIIKQKHLFSRAAWLEDVPFITRLSLYDEFRSPELELDVLNYFLKDNGAVIYSLGATELDDDDFFDYQNDEWESYWEKKLWGLGWLTDGRLWYTFNHDRRLLEPDPVLLGED